MIGAATLLRGVARRFGPNLMILIVAVVAATAAAAGPIYYAASRTSILRDNLAAAPTTGRGIELTMTGGLSDTIGPLNGQLQAKLDKALGGAATAHRLFEPPVEALEGSAFLPDLQETIPLVWRTNVCAHLAIVGACPSTTGQVLVATSLAQSNSWRLGQRIRFPTFGVLTVTGIYRPPTTIGDYFYDRGSNYFPFERNAGNAPAYDAMFTPQSTLEGTSATDVQGTNVVVDSLAPGAIQGTDVGRVSAAFNALVNDPDFDLNQDVVTSEIPATLHSVSSGWRSLEVPVFLITVQLLALAWLLLFLVVTEAVEARGPEVALAKLRGHGRLRSTAFGLSEPLLLVAVSVPAGSLGGWLAAKVLAGSLLRSGTPVSWTSLGWLAAALAAIGGLAATVLAARKTLVRPVVEQWRRAGRNATNRGWITDAVLLAGAAAGLLELSVSGEVVATKQRVLSLLVPGLLGLAVAVVASRLLPVACRAATRARDRSGSLAMYLALRQAARRPGGVRTTILLGTSFALFTFAVSAWVVGHDNNRRVAAATVGAPRVLTVTVPADRDLSRLVTAADPNGHQAVAVASAFSNGSQTLAVDPSRFAAVASWPSGSPWSSPAKLRAALAPPEPPPLVLTGDALRLRVSVSALRVPPSDLIANVVVPNGVALTPVDLGLLPSSGGATLTAPLTGCPCTVNDLTVNLPPSANGSIVSGQITLADLQQRQGGRWTSLPALSSATAWRPGADSEPSDAVNVGTKGLGWTFVGRGNTDPSLASVNRPSSLPALSADPLHVATGRPFTGTGLDLQALPLTSVGHLSAVPGAPADGAVVDDTFAALAAEGNTAPATQQVWLAHGAPPQIEARLKAAGVTVTATQTSGSVTAKLSRQGPSLASVLFLADAAACALLAAVGAIVGLYLSARRRRYEYAALRVSGVSEATLLRSLLAEQLLVAGFGIVVGIASGLAATALALRNVPEFVTKPSAPPLSYTPAAAPLVIILVVLVVALFATFLAAGVALLRGVRLDQLREAPS